MPRVIMGAVTMKMMSRTRMTSTRGVTLMSDSAGPNRPRPRPGRVIAIASDADLARFDGSRGGAAGLDLHLGDRSESEDEAIDAAAQAARPGEEQVVADDGRDGAEQPRERCDGSGGRQEAEVAVEAFRLGRRGLLEAAPHAIEDPRPLLVGDA